MINFITDISLYEYIISKFDTFLLPTIVRT